MLQLGGMDGGILEGGLDNQMGRMALSSEDLSNKNRENGSPYETKVPTRQESFIPEA